MRIYSAIVDWQEAMKRVRDDAEHERRLGQIGLAGSREQTLIVQSSSAADAANEDASNDSASVMVDGWPLDMDFWRRYTRVRLLGHGVTSEVYLVRRNDDAQLFALKLFRTTHQAMADNERAVLLRLRQLEAATQAPECPPSVVCYVAHMLVPHFTTLLPVRALLMTYVAGVDVDKINWDVSTGVVQPAVARRLITSALEALAYVHARNIAHRDLKPANVRVSAGAERLVLMDFGVACGTVADQVPVSCGTDRRIVGTPCYLSPERADLMRQPQTLLQLSADDKVRMALRGDVWALGATLFTLLSPTHRWGPCTAPSLTAMRELLHTDFLPDAATLYPSWPALAAVVLRMLAQDPSARLTAQEALNQVRMLGEVPQ